MRHFSQRQGGTRVRKKGSERARDHASCHAPAAPAGAASHTAREHWSTRQKRALAARARLSMLRACILRACMLLHLGTGGHLHGAMKKVVADNFGSAACHPGRLVARIHGSAAATHGHTVTQGQPAYSREQHTPIGVCRARAAGTQCARVSSSAGRK